MSKRLPHRRIGQGDPRDAEFLREQLNAIQRNFDFIERHLNLQATVQLPPTQIIPPAGVSALLYTGWVEFTEEQWEQEVTITGASNLWKRGITLTIETPSIASEAWVAWQKDDSFLVRLNSEPFHAVFAPDELSRGIDSSTNYLREATPIGHVLVRYYVWELKTAALVPPVLITPFWNKEYQLLAVDAGLAFPEPDIVDFSNCRIRFTARALLHSELIIATQFDEEFQHYDGTTWSKLDVQAIGIKTSPIQPWGLYGVRVVGHVPWMVRPYVHTMNFNADNVSFERTITVTVTFRHKYTELLIWQHVPGAGAYDLEYNVQGSGAVLVEDIAGTTYDLSAALDAFASVGPSFTWRVRAKPSAGGTPTAWSETRSSRTLTSEPNTDSNWDPTTAPTSLSVNQTTDADWGKKLEFNWASNASFTYSEIEIWNNGESLLLFRGFHADEDGPYYYYPQPAVTLPIRPLGHAHISNQTIKWRVRNVTYHAVGNWTAFQSHTIT